jgi:tellurite resistance protein TerC
MDVPAIYWMGFIAGVVLLLAMDLGLFNRRTHQIRLREAALWSGFCILLALLLGAGLWLRYGEEAGVQFLTGYLVELSLSVDNLFVFAVLFRYFQVPGKYQHRVLFWGIFGAIVIRAVMIFSGVALVNRFHWLLPVFGGILIVTGLRMLRHSHEAEPAELDRHPVLRLIRRVLPVTPIYEGQRFFVRQAGRWLATPLLVVLVMIELTDVLFALDSIPAILGITREAFLIFTSNIMAVLGLRAMYFVLARIIETFRYLHYGLSLVLVFIGGKMIAELFHVEVPITPSLFFIAGVLLTSVIVSLLVTRYEARRTQAPGDVLLFSERDLDGRSEEGPPAGRDGKRAVEDQLAASPT